MEEPQNPGTSPSTTPAAEEEKSPGAINADVPIEGEASSTASSRASRASGPFVEDAGPGFDPETAPEGPELPPAAELRALPELEPGWEEEVVRTLLNSQGELLHAAIGVAEQDWRHTQADLGAIAPPLTRILNRYDQTRAVAAMGDPVALALGLGMYGARSARERREVLKAIAAEPEVPITGQAAPPGTGPPDAAVDPAHLDWQL